MSNSKKPYSFKLPEKLSFDEIAEQFISGYDQISEETKQHTLQVYAAYGCYGTPYFHGVGFPYCPLGEYS